MQEQLRQKKEYDIVIGEQDILGTQLIRRNDELALLYEKIKIQQSTLNKGQLQYRDRSASCITVYCLPSTVHLYCLLFSCTVYCSAVLSTVQLYCPLSTFSGNVYCPAILSAG